MLTNADLAVLNEAYRSSRKGVETINTVISKEPAGRAFSGL